MNKPGYSEWLYNANPDGGDPNKTGTSNYNYLKKAEKYSGTNTLELFDAYKENKNSFLRKYLDYRVFTEDTEAYEDCVLTLCDVLDALNKSFKVNDKYKIYNDFTSALLLLSGDGLKIQKSNVRNLIIPPSADERNDYSFYRFFMLKNISGNSSKVKSAVKSVILSLCDEDDLYALRDNISDAADSLLEVPGISGRVRDLLYLLGGLSSEWYEYFTDEEIVSYVCNHLISLFASSLGNECINESTSAEDESLRRALSLLAPFLEYLTSDFLKRLSDDDDEKYILALLRTNLVYGCKDHDGKIHMQVLPTAGTSLPTICENMSGLELCRLVREDSMALDILNKIIDICFLEKQRDIFARSCRIYDASVFELPNVLIPLTASLECDARNKSESVLLDKLISVFALSLRAKLDFKKDITPDERFDAAKRLLELFNKHSVTVLNTLRDANLEIDTKHFPMTLNLLVADTALEASGINAISAALSSSEKAFNLSAARGEITFSFRAAMLKICAIARSALYNAKSYARPEFVIADLTPCAKLLDTYKKILNFTNDFDEKIECAEIFTSGIKRFTAILSENNGTLRNILQSDSLGQLLLSGKIESFVGFKKSAYERIIPKELPPSIEGELRRSPQILSPKYLDHASFMRPYYMATLDSELCANKRYTSADIESAIFKKLFSGQKVLLTVNQLCDNGHILRLAQEPWFIRLLRSGDIVISYYHTFNNLTDYAAHQLQSSFKWSSMPFLDSSERKEQALRFLRGDAFDASVFDRPEAMPTIRVFKECLSIIDMSISAQSICYYYQRPGDVDIYALLQENIANFYSTRDGEIFRDIKFIHDKIDNSIKDEIANAPSGINKKYTRTEYLNRIDGINRSDFGNIKLSDAERDRLSRLAGTDSMTAVRDIVSDEYNYILGGLSSKYREHCYHSPLFVPEREDESFSFRDIKRITETGAAVDGDALVDYIDELRAKIYEKNMRAETLAANLNRNWNSAGLDFGIDELCGEFYVDNISVKTTENEKVNIKNTMSDDAVIHLQTGDLGK